MKNATSIIRHVAVDLGFAVSVFLFIPLYIIDGDIVLAFRAILGIGSFNFDIFSFITLLLPLIGSVILLINRKHAESLAMMVFLLAGFSLIGLPEYFHFVNPDITFDVVQAVYIIAIVLTFASSLLALTLANGKNAFTTYQIVEMAMLVGMAVVLDLPGLKIRIGTSGGSIGFTMVPLLILALRQGPLKGFIGAGIVYGFITCILDGWGLFSFPFDYLLGYGAMAIVGFFKALIFPKNVEKFNFKGALFLIIGIVLAVFARLMASIISGIVFWEYDFWGSLIYNVAYILPSGGIVLATMILLYDPLIRMNRLIDNRQNRAS